MKLLLHLLTSLHGPSRRLCLDRITSAVGVRADFLPRHGTNMHDPNQTMTRVLKPRSAQVISPLSARGSAARARVGSQDLACHAITNLDRAALRRRLRPSSSPARRVSRTRRPGSNWAGAKQPRATASSGTLPGAAVLPITPIFKADPRSCTLLKSVSSVAARGPTACLMISQ